MIGLSFSSVSKHNMWSYYDWVYCLLSVNTICGRIMIGLSLSSVSKHNVWSYYDWGPYIMFTDERNKPYRNTTFYAY
jgi:hypothetical protein